MNRLLALLPLAAFSATQALAEEVTVALDWTPNTNHIGLYVAEAKGFYDDAGLDVAILPYSDTSSTTLVANGVAEFGVLSGVSYFTRRAAGADLLATAAVVQHETGRVVMDGTRVDISTPADLDGKIYAGFGTDWEETLISTIIRNGGGNGDFETVTLGTSAYEALANGRVDFTLEVSTWEGVNSVLLNRPQKAFAYGDYGVPDSHTTLIGARETWLEENPETATAFTSATIEGLRFAAENPDEAADILIAATEGMLSNPELIRASMQMMVTGEFLMAPDGTVGLMDGDKMAGFGGFLFENGILRDADGVPLEERPDFSTWYSNAYSGAASGE